MFQTWLSGLVFVSLSMVVAAVGSRLMRRWVSLDFLQTHHEVGGFFIGVLGTIYAVLLAFVIFVVWNQYDSAKAAVSQEVNQLDDLLRMSKGFSDPVHDKVRGAIHKYANVVIDEEWASLAHGERSPAAQHAIDDVWDIYRQIDPQATREIALYSESLTRLNDLSDSRRLRIHFSQDTVPIVLLVLLWFGAAVTIGFTYFFGLRNLNSQQLMTAALTGVIIFILFLIMALDNPFAGDFCISKEPFLTLLHRS